MVVQSATHRPFGLADHLPQSIALGHAVISADIICFKFVFGRMGEHFIVFFRPNDFLSPGGFGALDYLAQGEFYSHRSLLFCSFKLCIVMRIVGFCLRQTRGVLGTHKTVEQYAQNH